MCVEILQIAAYITQIIIKSDYPLISPVSMVHVICNVAVGQDNNQQVVHI